MKTTGIVRNVDDLGRVVIPKSVRVQYGINVGDSMEILMDGSRVVFQKYAEGCIFCKSNLSDGQVMTYKGSKICNECWDGLQNG